MSKTKWYQKAICLLIALALALLASIPFVHQAAASPEQATFYSSDSDGRLMQCHQSYHDARTASSGFVYSGDSELWVGQRYTSPTGINSFCIWRGALFFDTSSLPDDAAITSATLSLHGKTDMSSTDFLITVVDGSVLGSSLDSPDYFYLCNQAVGGGTFNTSGFSTSDYNDIPLSETGMGWISKTGLTRFGLRSSRDISATAPNGEEFVQVCASEKGQGYQPKLVVTYTATPPAVGGEAYPVNKPAILMPWIALAAAIITGAILYIRRFRTQS